MLSVAAAADGGGVDGTVDRDTAVELLEEEFAGDAPDCDHDVCVRGTTNAVVVVICSNPPRRSNRYPEMWQNLVIFFSISPSSFFWFVYFRR